MSTDTRPLAGAVPFPFDALRTEPFVCLPADSGLRRILDSLTEAAGFRPAVPFESTNLARLRDLVSHGLGMALLARSVAEAPGPGRRASCGSRAGLAAGRPAAPPGAPTGRRRPGVPSVLLARAFHAALRP